MAPFADTSSKDAGQGGEGGGGGVLKTINQCQLSGRVQHIVQHKTSETRVMRALSVPFKENQRSEPTTQLHECFFFFFFSLYQIQTIHTIHLSITYESSFFQRTKQKQVHLDYSGGIVTPMYGRSSSPKLSSTSLCKNASSARHSRT